MILIGKKPLTAEDFYKILYTGEQIDLDPAALAKVNESHEFLKSFSKNKLIYGINTGFGPMAQYKISEQNQLDLQYNLIRSHCTGAGNRLSDINVKSAMICSTALTSISWKLNESLSPLNSKSFFLSFFSCSVRGLILKTYSLSV